MALIGFISDVHANREALEAVLGDAESVRPDIMVSLGDVVGYGPDPVVCLDLVAAHCDVLIRGNHEDAMLGPEADAHFKPRVLASLQHGRSVLSPGHEMLIDSMRDRAEIEGVGLTHGSFGPRRYEYLYNIESAGRALRGFDADIGVVGHTHIPSIFFSRERDGEAAQVKAYAIGGASRIDLPSDCRIILNPGSVGQPRDRNPDASWAVLDTTRRTFELRRVAYDVTAVARRMNELGLPDYHALRLQSGV